MTRATYSPARWAVARYGLELGSLEELSREPMCTYLLGAESRRPIMGPFRDLDAGRAELSSRLEELDGLGTLVTLERLEALAFYGLEALETVLREAIGWLRELDFQDLEPEELEDLPAGEICDAIVRHYDGPFSEFAREALELGAGR